MAGSALLAWLFGYLVTPGTRTRLWRLFAGTGLLGAFTTFSTWMFDTEHLAQEGRAGFVALNVVLPMVAGLAAAGLGWAAGAALA